MNAFQKNAKLRRGNYFRPLSVSREEMTRQPYFDQVFSQLLKTRRREGGGGGGGGSKMTIRLNSSILSRMKSKLGSNII